MTELRPADLALFLLASGELMPRQRARDQQADLAGMELKRRVLDLVVSYDPAPGELEPALVRIVQELGPPYGPARAICAMLRDELADAAGTPALLEWLIDEAVREGSAPREARRGRKRREPT